jgi:carboxymethylenebutenolidase
MSSKEEIVAVLDRHVAAELAGDLETTMATMTDTPHLHNLPTMMGGVGREGVRAFYRDHLVGKFFPPDVTMTPVSRTVSADQIVDELVISFTHTTEIDWLLPGVAPTGRRVEVAFAVFAGIKDGKISHEHIYWDQATVLAQIGLIDPAGLPVVGAESARRLLDPSRPPRRL